MHLNLSADEVLKTTRSVRKRLDFDKPVERSVVEECLQIALQAPTGSNSQGWQFVIVEGLEGGCSALIQKLHHTVTDGQGGVALSMQFLDLTRDAPPPPEMPEPADDDGVHRVQGHHHGRGHVADAARADLRHHAAA